jgi:hypothetical protein
LNAHQVIQSQYLSALGMLKQAIVKCPPEMWDAPQDKDKFWFKAMHAVYYAHLYLQPTRRHFVRWRGHHDPDRSMAATKQEVLDYLAFVATQVRARVPELHLKSKSGFWEDLDKLELQFYNIRHIQQHAGELYERLDARATVRVGWVSTRHRRRK